MNTSAIDNSIICEYLVSQGYIVLSTMAKGQYTELQQQNINSIEVQADDLGFLLSYAKEKYKNNKIGVFGFSIGGLANIIFASDNKSIDATVSLDGSIMSQGWLNDFMKTDLYKPKEFTSNLLFIGKNLKAPDQNLATFLDEVKYADKALIRYDIDNHNYFSGLYLMYEMIDNEKLTDRQKETNYSFYAEMAFYVGHFFNQYLKEKNTFKRYPKASVDFSFKFQKGNRAPLDQNSISRLIIDKGFYYVDEIINSTLLYEKDYLKTIDWRNLRNTANQLESVGRINEAIQTLLLANKINPNFYSIHQKLGKLYLNKKDLKLAKNHFQIAIKDNPRNFESLNTLKQMKIETTDYHKTRIKNLEPYFGKYIVDEKWNREIYMENDELYLTSNYWDEPVKLWPYKTNLFLIESNNPKYNI